MTFDNHVRDARAVAPSNALRALRDFDLSTVDGIAAATIALENGLHGYVRPAAHGAGTCKDVGGGDAKFEVRNEEGHDLPAMVLSGVCGHRRATEAVVLSSGQIDLATALMGPAEGCRAYQHPNLAAWRRISAHLRDAGGVAVAVFVDEDAYAGQNPIVRAFFSP